MALFSSMILVSDGTLQTIHLTFPFRVKEDIRVYVSGREYLVNDGWVWSGNNTIKFDTPIPSDVTVWVRRLTDLSGVPHIFGEVSGATGRSEFTYVTVDENFEYILEASQDALDSFEFTRGTVESTRDWAELAVLNAELALQYANAANTSKQLSEAARLASEAAKVAASNSASQAASSATSASSSAALAKDWATKTDGTVDGSGYSAKYWAQQAKAVVTADTVVNTTDSSSISFSGLGSPGDPLTAEVIFGTTSGTAAQGDDSRITGAAQKSANLSDLTDKETARSNLGLGGAATRDVGTSSGQLMEVGAFGLGGGYPAIPSAPIGNSNPTGFYYRGGEPGGAFFMDFRYTNDIAGFRISNTPYTDNFFLSGALSDSTLELRPPVEIYHSGNTTVDSNGFIKRASPIIKLFSDSIEKTEHLEIEEVELERVGVGHYVLHNVPSLSKDGWYIETPKDRNNNIYFYLDYDENETDKTLTIKTYEPDYSTGRAEVGEPVDIVEGRYVSLRFSEDPSLYESMVALEDES